MERRLAEQARFFNAVFAEEDQLGATGHTHQNVGRSFLAERRAMRVSGCAGIHWVHLEDVLPKAPAGVGGRGQARTQKINGVAGSSAARATLWNVATLPTSG